MYRYAQTLDYSSKSTIIYHTTYELDGARLFKINELVELFDSNLQQSNSYCPFDLGLYINYHGSY